MPPIPVVFGLIAFAGVFLLFLGISQMRRAAGGADDFQARLAAYGVTTAGAQALPQSTGLRDSLNRLFQPAADRMGRGDVKKGKPSVTEQLQRADLKLRPSEYFMIQLGSGVVVGLIGYWRWGLIFGLLFFAGYLIPGFYVKYRVSQRLKKFNSQLADTIRERVRIKGEIQTLTAQAKASGTIITALPILLAVFMFFVTPTYFQPMFSSIIGWILIAIGAFMIFIGNLIIRRIVAIEV